MTDRTPPNDEQAERAAMSLSIARGRLPDEFSIISGKDFYQPAHEQMWTVILGLLRDGKSCDSHAVRARLQETGQTKLLPLLVELLTAPLGVDPATVAGIIIDRSGRRHIIEQTTRTLQDAYSSPDSFEEIHARAESNLARVPTRDTDNLDNLVTLDEFLGEAIQEPEWVIEGLLARGERLVITGTEGLGKSTWLRQMALCTAAGMDPFTGRATTPRTVLVIDAENPHYIMQKRFEELRRAVNAHGKIIGPQRLWLARRPEGMDLAHPADRRWLERRVRVVNPDLLVIGPAYKLHTAGNDDKDETIARTVTSVLDHVRTMNDCALLLEHHSGNEQGGQQRNPRPFGSSLWRRWPEFGYGIRAAKPPKYMSDAEAEKRRIVDVISWRGDRDARPWPRQMESGGDGLPWVECVIQDDRRTA